MSTSSPESPFGMERQLHREGYRLVAGVDEAGRGCLAGPVVAGAVILAPGTEIAGVQDSKRLSPTRREELLATIREKAVAVATGQCSPEEIDEINILQAALKAMQRAVKKLEPAPDYILIDGNKRFPTVTPSRTVIKGDDRSHTIGAASILSKVVRDQIMVDLDKEFPQYGWAQHKGYPTPGHYEAIAEHGPSRYHRHSFNLAR